MALLTDTPTLTGRILAHQKEFALFETFSGRVIRLSGVARQLCELAVRYELNLVQALNTLQAEQKTKDALSLYLQECDVFGNKRRRFSWRKILSGRIEFPVFREAWVQGACSLIHSFRTVIFAFLAIGMIAGASQWLLDGGSLSMSKDFERGAPVFSLFLLNIMLHELGHAYALHYHGQKPGVIGLKIFGPMLAAYTDVNRAWMLDPWGRAIVSISGILVQCATTFIIAGALTSWYGVSVANFFVTITLITLAFMTLPIRENDGDWFLKDITSVIQTEWLKSTLEWARKIFWALGIGFLAVILYRGWTLILPIVIEKIYTEPRINAGSLLYILIAGFIIMGTWSLVGMAWQAVRAIVEIVRTWRGTPQPA